MREKTKDEKYFQEFITRKRALIQTNLNNLSNGTIPENRIDSVKSITQQYYTEKLIAEYSLGNSFSELTSSLKMLIDVLPDFWVSSKVKVKKRVNTDTVFLNQYMVEPYGRMLRILSLGFLLKVSDPEFQRIVDVIDRDNVSDNLYEFIIRAKFSERIQKKEEDYHREKSLILEVYDQLRGAISASNKSAAVELVKKYLDEDFYHRHTGFYDSHKSRADTYYGYWSFESAAIGAILDLDDRILVGHPYYPKELADYFRRQSLPR